MTIIVLLAILAAGMALAPCVGPARAVAPPPDEPAPAYADKAIRERHEFRIDTSKGIAYRLTDLNALVVLGSFDVDGNFVRNPVLSRAFTPYKGSYAANDPQVIGELKAESINFQDTNTRIPGSTEGVYEYRCGKLVPGSLVYPGRFVPTSGGKIISIDEYTPKKGATRIYNLPGEFVELPKGEIGKPFSTAVDKRGQLSGKLLSNLKLEPDTERVVGMLQQKKVMPGKLDNNGTFIPLPDVPAVDRPESGTTVEVRSGSLKMVIPVINMIPGDKTVFEYRGPWSLVCGRLRPDGSFEPKADTSVITMNEYMIYVDAKIDLIYNLPGRLVPVKKSSK